MNVLTLYLGSLGFFALGAVLIYDTSPFSLTGGSKYEWKARRRLLAKVFFASGGLCLVMGLVAQLSAFMLVPR